MKKYELIETWSDSLGVYMMSTETAVATTIFSELQAIITAPQVETSFGYWRWHKLDHRDPEIFVWFKAWLCQQGFEPFSIYQRPTSSDGTGGQMMYNFRREITPDSQ